MTLSLSVRHRFGSLELEAAFDSPDGLTAVFGASGAGKTSILRLIAGLVRPVQGRITLGDDVLVDTAQRRFVPAYRRGIGYVFQEPRLLPHLTVRQNLAYGGFFSRRQAPAIDFDRVVALLDIGALLPRHPGTLSGGEAQRVAIGRALLSRPRLLLMDEPLASIDELRKAEILPYVERLRDELRIPIVYVSHALDEIVRLATTLVVVNRGRIAAAGPAGSVLSRIDLPILAHRRDAGVVLDVEVDAHDEHWHLSRLRCRAGLLSVPRIAHPPGSALRIWVRARDVSLATEPPRDTSILNVLPAHIVQMAPGDGATVDILLDCGGQPLISRITRLSASQLGLAPGMPVFAMIKGVAFERG